jgi:murein DD-endopeptidase MepM/ murein hydrolase activator NlpD
MVNTLKNILIQSLYTCFDYSIRKFSIFVSLFLVALFLVGANIYVYNMSFSLLTPRATTTEIEEEVSENTVSTITIAKGDTLNTILKRENISNEDIQKITKVAASNNLTLLKVGKKITFEYNLNLVENGEEELAKEEKSLSLISFEIDNIKSINIIRTGDDFSTEVNSVPLTKLVTKYETTVDSNVISSLKQAGLSSNSIISLINTYSHQIDFQRQIQRGDKITVITEKFVTPDSKLSHHGDIIYASIQTQGNEYKIYKYSPTGQKENYEFFSEKGQSTKGTLLKTPIKVVRISSKFGYRHSHPVHGYGAMHKGVDFAAPVGTPIYAAGNGIVEFIGWISGYGRIIVLKHNNNLSTAYAHASRFASGLKKGSSVKQGDTIAFVGTSGNVTGAHLHYEVRENGKQINPANFKSTPSIQLTGMELAKFNKFKSQISRLESKLEGGTELAANDVKEVRLF